MKQDASHLAASSAPESVLGFDFGAWRVGVAVGERLIGSGKPVTTLHNADAEQIDWKAVLSVIEQWQPQTLVVGWPVDDQGDCYPIAAAIRRFAARLHEKTSLPVWLVDERLSSEQARLRLGAKSAQHDPQQIDAMAAAIIIDHFFAAHAVCAITEISKHQVQASIDRHQQRSIHRA